MEWFGFKAIPFSVEDETQQNWLFINAFSSLVKNSPKPSRFLRKKSSDVVLQLAAFSIEEQEKAGGKQREKYVQILILSLRYSLARSQGERGGGSDAPLINCSTPTFLQRQDRMLLHNISSPPLNKNSWINSCRVTVSEEPFENTDEQSS